MDDVIIIDDFLPMDIAMQFRQAFIYHFANPHRHTSDHQVWNYWHVPGIYTYLRTGPEKLGMPYMQLISRIQDRWFDRSVTWPYVSLYVAGCRQGWHNDALNGHRGWVYSITSDDRKSTGGETLVWRGIHKQDRPNAGVGLHHVIEPKFNRLIVFDDQLPHAVSIVEGSMDPIEGRVVLHGHIQ